MKRLAPARWAMRLCALVALPLLILLPLAHAGSPVWKIAKGNSHIYLGGTIHLLGQADWPLPDAFDQAFGSADILVFETDLAATQTPEFGQKMMGQLTYSGGRSLKDRIRPATFQALGRFAKARGLAPADLTPFKPGLVMVFLTMAQMKQLGIAGKGVDEFYFEKANEHHLPVRFLESPTAQIRFLSDIGKKNEDEMIRYIIKDVGKLPGLVGRVKTAWRNGDLPTLYAATTGPLKKDFPRLYRSLMVSRNTSWLPKIKEMLATPAVEFILVGAAHLAGNDGLIHRLATAGYTAANL